MKDLLKNVVYAGVGAAFLTRDKIEEVRGELVEKGKITKDEGKEFVDDLIKRSESAKDQLELWLTRQVEDRVNQLNLATTDEVADLRRQVEELQVVINRESRE
ncbi:MAG: hypothetical protein U9P36_12225 [Thermodesulfobacteriota bacterium]|nr:hypothetical protein [Thermodesulfobacteriota bacterium]